VIRHDGFDRLADLQATPGVLQKFTSHGGETQATGRALEKTHSELVFQIGHAPLTLARGILKRRAASGKLFASTTAAKIISALKSVIDDVSQPRSSLGQANLD
jgi:hypothetical protein